MSSSPHGLQTFSCLLAPPQLVIPTVLILEICYVFGLLERAKESK